MSMSKCRKFEANVFNKSKCQACFKDKELHTAEALECSKAARRVSKCGYLFVAPETFDFNSPLDKTRRWQRRFCVLYDDGELSYLVDENVGTIPQGVIDMNKCTDVFDAENVTTHTNSICVATPSRSTYIKGTAKEEINRWHDVLVMYPRSIKTKHRRTPPYSLPPKLPDDTSNKENLSPLKQNDSSPNHGSSSPGSNISSSSELSTPITSKRHTVMGLSSPYREIKEPNEPEAEPQPREPQLLRSISDHGGEVSSKRGSEVEPPPITYRGIRSLKHKKDKAYQEGLRKSSSMHDMSEDKEAPVPPARSRSREAVERRRPEYRQQSPSRSKSPPRSRSSPPRSRSPEGRELKAPRSASEAGLYRSRSPTSSLLLNGRNKNETDERKMAKSGDLAARISESPQREAVSPRQQREKTEDTSFHDDLMYMKKGWLLKQTGTEKEWIKHWFVLSGTSLKYYRDARSEEIAPATGTIDLSVCHQVSDTLVSRNYGFIIRAPQTDHVLSAMTSGIRNNWIQAIQKCIDTHTSPRSDNNSCTATLDSSTPIKPAAEPKRYPGVSPVEQSENQKSSPVMRRRRRITTDSVLQKEAEEERKDRRRTMPGLSADVDQVDGSPPDLSTEEEKELDNVERNIRKIHRKSITDFVQKHSPQHFDKFESGSIYKDSDREQRERSSSSERSTPISSGVSSPREDYTPRRRRPDLERLKSPSHPRSPSARVKDKTRAKSPRAKSPPLDKHSVLRGSDMTDSPSAGRSDTDNSVLEDSVLGLIEMPSSRRRRDSIEQRWKEVEHSTESSSANGDTAVVELLETEVETLKAKLERTQGQVSTLQQENTELRGQIRASRLDHRDNMEDLDKDKSRYLSQIEEMQAEMEQATEYLQSELTKSETQSDFHQLQVSGMKQRLEESEEAMSVQRQEIETLQAKLAMTVSDLSSAETELNTSQRQYNLQAQQAQRLTEDMEQRIVDLERDLSAKDAKLTATSGDGSVHSKLREKQDKLSELEADLSDFEATKQELAETSHFLADMKQEMSILKQQLREQDEAMEKASKDGSSKIKNMEDEFYSQKEQLETTIQQLQERLDDVLQQSSRSDSHYSNIADILREKDETIAQLEEKLIENDSKIEELHEELNLEIADNAKMQQNMDDFSSENARFKSDVNQLKSRNSQLENEILQQRVRNTSQSDWEREREKLENAVRSMDKELQTLNETNASLKDDLEEVRVDSEIIKETLEQKNQENDQLTQNLSQNNHLAEVLRQDKEKLEQEYEDCTIKIRSLEKQIQHLQSESHPSDVTAEEYEELQERFEDLSLKLDGVEQSKVAVEEELAALQEQYQEDMEHRQGQVVKWADDYTTLNKEHDATLAELRTAVLTVKNIENELESERESHQKEANATQVELNKTQTHIKELQEKLEQQTLVAKQQSNLLSNMKKTDTVDAKVDKVAPVPKGRVSFGEIPQNYDELKEKYTVAVQEVKRLRQEAQNSNRHGDGLESSNHSLKQELKNLEIGYEEQLNTHREKVQDLSSKLSAADRRIRRLERKNGRTDLADVIDQEVQTDDLDLSPKVIPEDSVSLQAELLAAQESDLHNTSMDSLSSASTASTQISVKENASDKINALQSELSEKEEKLQQISSRLLEQADLQMEIANLQQTLDDLRRENNDYHEHMEYLITCTESKDFDLVTHLKEVKVKQEQTAGALEQSRDRLAELIRDLQNSGGQQDVVSSLKHIMADCDVRSQKTCSPQQSKLRMFAERLALESIVLSEVAQQVRISSDDLPNGTTKHIHLLHDSKHRLVQLEQTMKSVSPDKSQDTTMSDASEDNISHYATLLANKLVLQQKLSAIYSSQDVKQQSPFPKKNRDSGIDVMAKEAVFHAQLDQHMYSGSSQLENGESSLFSTSLSAKAIVHSDLSLVYRRVQESLSQSGSSQEFKSSVKQEVNLICEQLIKQQSKVVGSLDRLLSEKISVIAKLMADETSIQKGSSVESRHKLNKEILESEFTHIIAQCSEKHKLRLCSEQDQHDSSEWKDRMSSIDSVVKEDTRKAISSISEQHYEQLRKLGGTVCKRAVQDIQQERSSMLIQMGEVIAQRAVVCTYVNCVIDQVGQSTSQGGQVVKKPLVRNDSGICASLPSSPNKSSHFAEQLAESIERDSSVRSELSAYLLNNTATENCDLRENISLLAAELMDIDQSLMAEAKGVDFAGLVSREAMFQCQLSYALNQLKLNHKEELEHLRAELEQANKAAKARRELEVEELQEEIDRLINENEKMLQAEAPDAKEKFRALQADIDWKEKGYRQEIQALKDGYEIRMKSLQGDLVGAQSDLDKLQRDREDEIRRYEKKLQEYEHRHDEDKLQYDRVQEEKDLEVVCYERKISELEDSLDELNRKQHQAEQERRESLRDQSEEGALKEDMNKLRMELEQERSMHLAELESLRRGLESGEEEGTQAVLNTKIQQLEAQIENMQADYERELAVQKAAHCREIARDKDDMLQLLASAESKSMHIDENTIRKKYLKDIEKVKNIYDTGFTTMEKSHQRVIMEMRRAHKQEMESLRQEKEQLLTEETKATQAALDAMRRAHGEEVQKERNKFLDVIAKTYSTSDVESLQKQHEEDLELIQGEIRQLSEQFSIKCLECASLEERLELQTRALTESRKRVQNLIARYEELNVRYKHEIEKLKKMISGRPLSASAPSSPLKSPEVAELQDLKVSLKLHEEEQFQMEQDLETTKETLKDRTEELEANIDKYHYLYDEHQRAKHSHDREVTELRSLLRETTSTMVVNDLDVIDDVFSPVSSLTTDSAAFSPRDSSERSEGHKPVTPDPLTSDLSTPGGGSGRLLPSVPAEARSAKKALWRQRQPQRAKSNPGLPAGVKFSMPLTEVAEDVDMTASFSPRSHGNSDISKRERLRTTVCFNVKDEQK